MKGKLPYIIADRKGIQFTLNIFVINITYKLQNLKLCDRGAGPAGENSTELQCFLMSVRLTRTTKVKNKPRLQTLLKV